MILLGFKVDCLGLYNTEDRIQAVRDLKFPETLQQLERFIGFTGFLRHLIPRYSHRVDALQRRKTAMLAEARKSGKLPAGNNRVNYTKRVFFEPVPDELAAFKDLKKALGEENALFHHDPDRPLFIQIDAAKETGFAGVVFHLAPGFDWDGRSPIPGPAIQPIMYLSKTINQAEKKYFPTELEVACLVWLVKKLRTVIGSNRVQPINILTDHAATVDIVNQTHMGTVNSGKSNMRLVLAAEFLNQYRLNPVHIPGRTNILADAGSRLPSHQVPKEDAGVLDNLWEEFPDVGSLSAALNDELGTFHAREVRLDADLIRDIAAGYDTVPKWESILEQLSTHDDGTNLPFTRDSRGLLHLKDVHGKQRLCIPNGVADVFIAEAHDNNHHFGVDKVWHALTDQYVIPHCRRKVQEYIKFCRTCQENRNDNQPTLGSMQPVLSVPIPFHTIAIDFIVKLPSVPVSSYPWVKSQVPFFDGLLTVTDKFSKATLLIPGNSVYTAGDWAKALLAALYIGNWGLPKRIISDRDPKFLSALWKELWAASGTKLAYSTAHHPQTDGQSEVKNRVVELAIRNHVTENPDSPWTDILPALQMNLNNSYMSVTRSTANKILYGMNTRTGLALGDHDRTVPREMYQEEAQLRIAEAQMYMKQQYDRKHRRHEFRPGDWVYIRLHHGYTLPGKPAPKFSQQRIGPFKVIRKVGNMAYEVDLPANLHFNPVISIAHLRPAEAPCADPYGRDPTYQDPVDVPGEETPVEGLEEYKNYEVERILDRRDTRSGRGPSRREYLIKWKGYPNQHNVWMPVSALQSDDLIREYEEQRSRMELLESEAKRQRPGAESAPEPGDLRISSPAARVPAEGRPAVRGRGHPRSSARPGGVSRGPERSDVQVRRSPRHTRQ